MKLLKAYIRTTRVEKGVHALEEAGAPGITISHVHGLGYGYEPFIFTLAPSEVKKAPEVVKKAIKIRTGVKGPEALQP